MPPSRRWSTSTRDASDSADFYALAGVEQTFEGGIKLGGAAFGTIEAAREDFATNYEVGGRVSASYTYRPGVLGEPRTPWTLVGFAQVARLEGTEAIGGLAGRTPLAVPPGGTDLAPSGPVGQVFTGGYAAGAGQSQIPSGATISDILPNPYVFRSPTGDGVRMGFSAADNAAVAEFGPMTTFGSPDISDITLNFGNAGSRDAMLDDSRFVMDQALLPTGPLTGQAQSISGLIDTTLVATVSEAGATAGNHFGGTLRDAANFDAVGAIDGSFFTGGADPSAATAGAFDFKRPTGEVVTQTVPGSLQKTSYSGHAGRNGIPAPGDRA